MTFDQQANIFNLRDPPAHQLTNPTNLASAGVPGVVAKKDKAYVMRNAKAGARPRFFTSNWRTSP